MPKEGTQSKEKYSGSVCHWGVGWLWAVMGRGLDPTLLAWYHGRRLEGSKMGEENLKAAKSKTVLFLMCIQDAIG